MNADKLPAEISSLPILLIEVHSRCNCRCTMCDIWKSTETRSLTVGQLERQLDSLHRLGTKWVVFTGGEPLMSPDVFAMADLLRAQGIQVTMLSSGLLFERYADNIAERLDTVIVSLDGPREIHDQIRGVPGAFQQIEQGVAAIRRRRETFRIEARCTVQRKNHDALLQTVSTARTIGLSSLSFLAADLSSTAFNRATAWPQFRQDEIALTADQLPVLDDQLVSVMRERPFVSDSEQHLLRISAHFRANLGLQPFQSPRCNAPWTSAFWEASGALRPCFFQPSIGDLVDAAPLDQVLNSQQARHNRETLDVAQNPICQRCVCSLHYAS